MSRNYPECVITGADFFSPLEYRHVHGDLHMVGDAYIFNCNVSHEKGSVNPAWEHGSPDHLSRVVSPPEGFYFERRGVIVFARDGAQFNDAAMQYVRDPQYRPT